jgi:hypothetical protein
MPSLSLIMIACGIIGLDIALAHTETCNDEIAQLAALVDQSTVAKPTIPQSIGAQLHHQPKREPVRRAEENAQLSFAAVLARAKIFGAIIRSSANATPRASFTGHRYKTV